MSRPESLPGLTDHYDASYYEQVAGALIRDRAWYDRRARCAVKTYFDRLPRWSGETGKPAKSGRVLEYGCGIGQNIALLPNAVGFDASGAALAECAKRGVPTIDRPEAIPRGHFDCVLCRHVLEHVERPLDLVRELLSFLRPEGTLILVVPKEPHGRAGFEPDIHRHLFSWNFRCLNNLVWAAGSRPIANRCEPMFGPRTDAVLRPLIDCLGFEAYYRCGRIAGRVLGQYELVLHARPGAGTER